MPVITVRNGTIGILKGTGESESFQSKANFSLKIVAKVEGAKDGYIARVTRAPDEVTRFELQLAVQLECGFASQICTY